MTQVKSQPLGLIVTGRDAISELSPELFKQYVRLCKTGDPKSISEANSIWPAARKDAAAIALVLALIKSEPTLKQRQEAETAINNAEIRLEEIQEKISELQGAKFRLEVKRDRLKNSAEIQQTGPLSQRNIGMQLNDLVLKAACEQELREAKLL